MAGACEERAAVPGSSACAAAKREGGGGDGTIVSAVQGLGLAIAHCVDVFVGIV